MLAETAALSSHRIQGCSIQRCPLSGELSAKSANVAQSSCSGAEFYGIRLPRQEDVEWAEQQLAAARHKLVVSEKMTREIQRRLSVLKAGLAAAAPSTWRRKCARSWPARDSSDAHRVAF
jgi:hypothetical protein